MSLIEIVIDGVAVGRLDPERVTLRQQVELEEQGTLTGLIRWLEAYAEGDRDAILDLFDRLSMTDLPEVLRAVNSALAEAAMVPKARGASSAEPSRPVARGRRGGPSASATPSAGAAPRGSSRTPR